MRPVRTISRKGSCGAIGTAYKLTQKNPQRLYAELPFVRREMR